MMTTNPWKVGNLNSPITKEEMKGAAKEPLSIKELDLDSFPGKIYHNLNKQRTTRRANPLPHVVERGSMSLRWI